jgi:hypothetical protein
MPSQNDRMIDEYILFTSIDCQVLKIVIIGALVLIDVNQK